METLLAELKLTGISSENEVVGYKASGTQDGAARARYYVCAVEHRSGNTLRRTKGLMPILAF